MPLNRRLARVLLLSKSTVYWLTSAVCPKEKTNHHKQGAPTTAKLFRIT